MFKTAYYKHLLARMKIRSTKRKRGKHSSKIFGKIRPIKRLEKNNHFITTYSFQHI